MKQIVIDIRDFCVYLSCKKYGLKGGRKEYRFHIVGVFFFYYAALYLILFHLWIYMKIVHFSKTTSLLKLILLITTFIPVFFLFRAMLNYVTSIPLPNQLSVTELNRKRWITFSVILVGLLLFLSASVIPVYLLGGKIHFFGRIYQR